MAAGSSRCGFVAIVGAPNAGKSTLLNHLLGQKLAIVSAKPQTTRMRILGILTSRGAQVGLLDTPGIFTPKGRFDRTMVGAAWRAMDEADVICLLVDVARGLDAKTKRIVAQMKKEQKQAVLVLNKVDIAAKTGILAITQTLNETGIFTEVFMISAKTGDGVAPLKKFLMQSMPLRPWLFDPQQITDMPSSLLACEITREQIMEQLAQELPYAATVLPIAWKERADGSLHVTQRIIVMREGQKAIVIGKQGAQLKKIGMAARRALDKIFERKTHLFLEVDVKPDWRERPEDFLA